MAWMGFLLAREMGHLTGERVQRRREPIRLSLRHMGRRHYSLSGGLSSSVTQALQSAAHAVSSWLL
jgi:hypothetical protein